MVANAMHGDNYAVSRAQRPVLRAHFPLGYTFAFTLEGSPELLDGWDSSANLWVARPGVVEKFTLKGLRRGKSSYFLDVDQFGPPLKPQDSPRSAA
jgi:hypothetical protein